MLNLLIDHETRWKPITGQQHKQIVQSIRMPVITMTRIDDNTWYTKTCSMEEYYDGMYDLTLADGCKAWARIKSNTLEVRYRHDGNRADSAIPSDSMRGIFRQHITVKAAAAFGRSHKPNTLEQMFEQGTALCTLGESMKPMIDIVYPGGWCEFAGLEEYARDRVRGRF